MRTEFRILATRLWVRHARKASGDIREKNFIERFDAWYASSESGYGLKPTLLSEWKRGKRSVSETWVNRVELAIPGTKWVHSIGTLITPNRLSANAARGAVSQFFVTLPNHERRWVMPFDGVSTPTEWEDSAALAQRGDFAGFIAILALAREAFAERKFDRLCLHMTDLYTLLPSIARLEWVRPDVDLLLQCIEDMMAKDLRRLIARVEIDWQAFRSQVVAPQRWDGQPPWIVTMSDKGGENTSGRLLRRPVPLIVGTKPLVEYVRTPANEVPQISRRRDDDPFSPFMGRYDHGLTRMKRSP